MSDLFAKDAFVLHLEGGEDVLKILDRPGVRVHGDSMVAATAGAVI